jgi:endoglucanase
MDPRDPTPSALRQQPRIPRWRGFNLTEMVWAERGRPFLESDFAYLAEFGFDFARLPLSYWCWSDPQNPEKIDERPLAWLDQAIEFGRRYSLHVSLNLHRIPGYCVNGRELEKFDLFTGPAERQARALDAATLHWQMLADRYREIPSDRLSFDLINEPPFMQGDARYVEVVRTLVGAIREKSPDRLIVVDGVDIGQTPVPSIVDLCVVQSTRGYLPKALTHYTATWVPQGEFESFRLPTWPLTDDGGNVWDRDRLRHELIDKWQPLVAQGVPIHVGEWGCYKNTPHDVVLAWMGDLLTLWQDAGWGWAMWNLRGEFGVLDSGRSDVRYEDWRGHQLDRKMLELLREH